MKLFRTKRSGTTAQVQDSFLERFLGNAEGQSIKVYLYILHHIDEPLADSQIAAATGLTESDVRYALARWAREGELEWREVQKGWKENPDSEMTEIPGWKTSGDTLAERIEDTLGFRLTGEQKGYLLHLYGVKGIGYEVLNDAAKKIVESRNSLKGEWEDSEWFVLFTRCALNASSPGEKAVEKNHTPSGHSAARREAAAQAGSSVADEQSRQILKAVGEAFGIDCSRPGSAERKLISKWISYGYGAEIISHACGLAKLNSGKANWTYADRILGGWHDDYVTTVEEADAHEKKRQEARKKAGATGSTKPRSRFHNLEERDDDLDAWAREKMKKELESTDSPDSGNSPEPH